MGSAAPKVRVHVCTILESDAPLGSQAVDTDPPYMSRLLLYRVDVS